MVQAAERLHGRGSHVLRLFVAFLLIVGSVGALTISPAQAITDAEVDVQLTCSDNGAGGVDCTYVITNNSTSEDLTILTYTFDYNGTSYALGDFNCPSDDVFANGNNQTCTFTIDDVACGGALSTLTLRVSGSGQSDPSFNLSTAEATCDGSATTTTTESTTTTTDPDSTTTTSTTAATTSTTMGNVNIGDCLGDLPPFEAGGNDYELFKCASSQVVASGTAVTYEISIRNNTGVDSAILNLIDEVTDPSGNTVSYELLENADDPEICSDASGNSISPTFPALTANGGVFTCYFTQILTGDNGDMWTDNARASIDIPGAEGFTVGPSGDVKVTIMDDTTTTTEATTTTTEATTTTTAAPTTTTTAPPQNNCLNTAPDETAGGEFDIIKETSTPIVLSGGMATYTVEVGNHTGTPMVIGGLVDCMNGTSEDNLLDASGLVCVDPNGIIQVGLQTVASGDELLCTYSVQVNGNPGDVVTNIAAVSIYPGGTTSTPDAALLAYLQDTATVTIAQAGPVTLSVDKTDGGATVQEPGDLVTYTLTIRNTSNRMVTITELTDEASGGTPFNIDGIAGSDCTTGRRLQAMGSPGDSLTCSFTAFVGGDAGDTILDTVTVTAVDEAGVEGQGQGSESTPVVDVLPDITVGITDSGANVDAPSDDVTFNVTITNNGREEVTITEVLANIGDATGVDVTSVGGIVSATDFANGTTVAGFGGTYEFSYTAAISGDVGDNVGTDLTVAATDDDGNRREAAAAEATPVSGTPPTTAPPTTVAPTTTAPPTTAAPAMTDLRLVKGANGSFRAGENITYTMSVSNSGSIAATRVVLTDVIPTGTTFVSATGSGWSCGMVGGKLICEGPDMAPGAASSLLVTLGIASNFGAGSLQNSASVDASEDDANRANNTSVASNSISAAAVATTIPVATTQFVQGPLPITGANSNTLAAYGGLIAGLGLLFYSLLGMYQQQTQGVALTLPLASSGTSARYERTVAMRTVGALGTAAGRITRRNKRR